MKTNINVPKGYVITSNILPLVEENVIADTLFCLVGCLTYIYMILYKAMFLVYVTAIDFNTIFFFMFQVTLPSC